MQLGKNMERKNLTAVRVPGNFQVEIAPGKIRRRMRHQQAESALSGFGKSAVQVGRFAVGRAGKSIGNAGKIKVFADSRAVDRTFFDSHTPDLWLPGAPTHPMTYIDGMMNLLGRKTRQ